MSSFAAVFTGDLIASTKVGHVAVDGAMAVLENIALHEAEISGLDIRFARYRGDGWQMYCPKAARVFRLAVLILANLHSRPDLAQTRLAAATGSVETLPKSGLASAGGEVFLLSGHALDNMGNRQLAFESNGSAAHWQKPYFSYLDWQSSRWSPEQSQAIAMVFRHDAPEPRKSAEELGISRQAFSARLAGAGYLPLWDADRAFHFIAEAPP